MIDLERRPVVVALAGPNGAGKTTFYYTELHRAGLRFVNADVLARELRIGPYAAANVAAAIRDELVAQRASFVFETVLSDSTGEKVGFLKAAAAAGYRVVLCFIGLSGPAESEERVAMRVLRGGHDVPSKKLAERYPRTLANLRLALRELPEVRVYDNSDLPNPYRLVVTAENGTVVKPQRPLPKWLAPLLPGK